MTNSIQYTNYELVGKGDGTRNIPLVPQSYYGYHFLLPDKVGCYAESTTEPMRTGSNGKTQGGVAIEVYPSFYNFGEVESGYEPVDPVRFIIRNTGSLPVKNLSVSINERDIEKYWLCLAHTADTLGCAHSDDCTTCFFVYPWDRLECGTHTASLHIQADNMDSVQVQVSFTVCPKKSLPASSDLLADTAALE